QVSAAEIRIRKIRFYLGMLSAPSVPGVHVTPDQVHMFLVGHEPSVYTIFSALKLFPYPPQFVDFPPQRLHLRFQPREPICSGACHRNGFGTVRRCELDITRKPVRKSRFFETGLPWELLYKRRRLPIDQLLEAGLHGVQIIEIIHALCPPPEFTERLRTAQQQHAKESSLSPPKV